jgi:hypothetical protein
MEAFMTDGSDLHAALVGSAQGYREQAPVFRIEQPDQEKSKALARSLLNLFWNQFGDCRIVLQPVGGVIARMVLPNAGRLDIFHPSGAIAAIMQPSPTRKPMAPDESKVDRKSLAQLARQMAEKIAASVAGPNEELRGETLWELKGQGVTLRGEKSRLALFEVVGGFRRYLDGLPVLGRASIHVGIGENSQVVRWGVDWRAARSKPFAQTAVIPPEDGAKRVLEDLWWRRPERPCTSKDFEVKRFALGYVSFSRRREQFVMQPAWVAVLAPRGGMSMGHVVAVPAAPQAFEPMGRAVGIAPGA